MATYITNLQTMNLCNNLWLVSRQKKYFSIERKTREVATSLTHDTQNENENDKGNDTLCMTSFNFRTETLKYIFYIHSNFFQRK